MISCGKCGNKKLRRDFAYREDPFLSCPICGWIQLKGLQTAMPYTREQFKSTSRPPLSTEPDAVKARNYARLRKERSLHAAG